MRSKLSMTVSAVVALSACLLVAETCVAAGSPQEKCASAKMKAAGKKWSAKAKCYSKALGSSAAVNDDCLQKAEGKFTDAFAKAETAGGCTINGDAASIETKIDDSLTDVVGDLGCANGLIDGDEPCDGANFDGESCLTLGFSGGTLACSASCTLDTSGCSDCGDGNVTGGEQCDGANLAGETCISQGFSGGTLACSASCTLDTSGCTP